jgi:uncharacterized membrane protein
MLPAITILADDILRNSGSGINGNGLIHNLMWFFLIGLAIGLIWYVGHWFISKINPPNAVVNMLWDGLFIILGLVIAVNFLISLANGHGFINF